MNKSFLIILFIFFLSPSINGLSAENKPHDSPNKNNVEESIVKKIQTQLKDANNYATNLANPEKADSLYKKAINTAEATFNTEIILNTYIYYLTKINLHSDYEHVQIIIDKINSSIFNINNEKLIFDCNAAICKASIAFFDAENSLKYAIKLVSINGDYGILQKIESFLLLGKAFELNDSKKDAFENYLKAQELIAALKHDQKEKSTYELDAYLFDFYLKINQFDKAADYKMHQIEYITSHTPIDSTQLMWFQLDLCRLHIAENKEANIIPNLEQVIKYSKQQNQTSLFVMALSSYRSVLLNNEDIKGFYELYVNRFPENLQVVKEDAPSTFYIINAFIKEYENQIDSANHYFKQAEIEAIKDNNDIYCSNFYKRYGEFYLRNNRKEEALSMFTLSFEKAKKSDYLDYMLESSGYIESISLILEDFKNAYAFSKIHNELDLMKNQAMHEDNILKMELKSQARQMEILSDQKEQEKRRKYNLQYTIIIVGIMVLFLLLILASSLTVPEWLIEMLGFFSILFLFEFLILLLDHQIHTITHGAPLKVFLIKIAILSVIYPWHHVIENSITNYMKKNKMIGKITKESIKQNLAKLYPWMRKNNEASSGH